MLVENVLGRNPQKIVSVTPTTPIQEAMGLLISNRIGCLLALDDEDKLVGILSDKDILSRVYDTEGDYHTLTVKDLMTTELIVGLPTDDLDYVARVMEKNTIRHMPIIKDDSLVGVISMRDIVKTQLANREVENRYLVDMLEKRDRSGDA
jgi:CBS domain-containing protein